MQKVRLGKTELEVSKNGFGALPIQRITKAEAVYLLQKAFYHGINYFDTARAYSDSEENWEQLFPIHGKSWLSVPKQRLRMKRISGKI